MRLFGTSGIRRLAEDLPDDFCTDLARAVSSILPQGSKVYVANDPRKSGPRIKAALVKGMVSSGCDITDLGLLPTPALCYLTKKSSSVDAGVMLTASHNPPEYNGMKMWQSDGMGFTPEMENRIEDFMKSKKFRQGDGIAKKADISGDFISGISEMVSPKKMRILIDAGNGAASILAPRVFEKLGFDVTRMNCEPDGDFPNRNPEPRPDTLQKTISAVTTKTGFGLAFDGDADRVVFIDKRGFMGYNEPLAFTAMLRVQHESKKKIVTTVETGRLIDLAVEPFGGKVVRTRVGDVFVASETKRSRAAFGCEQCGVYVMPEFGFFPSSIYSSAWLLENGILNMREELKVPKLYFDKIKIQVDEGESVMEKISEETKKFEAEVNDIDGIRLDFEDSWMLIRPSGTEPVIRVFAEAENKKRMEYLLEQGRDMVRDSR